MNQPLEYAVVYDGVSYRHSGEAYTARCVQSDRISVSDMERLLAEDQAYPDRTMWHHEIVPWEYIGKEGLIPPRRIQIPKIPVALRRLYVFANGELSASVGRTAIAAYNAKGHLLRYRASGTLRWTRVVKIKKSSRVPSPPSPPETPEAQEAAAEVREASEPPQPVTLRDDADYRTRADTVGARRTRTDARKFRRKWNEEWAAFMQPTSFQVRDVQADSEQLKRGRVAQAAAEVERKTGVQLRLCQLDALRDIEERSE